MPAFTREAVKALEGYSWPGNIRELENIIERAVVLNPGRSMSLEDLPEYLTGKEEELDVERFIPPNAPLQKTLEQIEEKLRRLSKPVGLNLAELDLYLWYLETGKVLK